MSTSRSPRRSAERATRESAPSAGARATLLGLRDVRFLVLNTGGRGESSLAQALLAEGLRVVVSTPSRAIRLDRRFDCVVTEWTNDLRTIRALHRSIPDLAVVLVSGGCSDEQLWHTIYSVVIDRARPEYLLPVYQAAERPAGERSFQGPTDAGLGGAEEFGVDGSTRL